MELISDQTGIKIPVSWNPLIFMKKQHPLILSSLAMPSHIQSFEPEM